MKEFTHGEIVTLFLTLNSIDTYRVPTTGQVYYDNGGTCFLLHNNGERMGGHPNGDWRGDYRYTWNISRFGIDYLPVGMVEPIKYLKKHKLL